MMEVKVENNDGRESYVAFYLRALIVLVVIVGSLIALREVTKPVGEAFWHESACAKK